MFSGATGFGMHTAMSKNGTMVTYKGYRNSLYESGLPFAQGNNMGIFDFGHNRCCHNHSCSYDSGLEKALGWGLLGGAGLGLVIAFAKPIGKALSAAGKGIASAAKWCWNGITKAASWCWNGIKSLFSKKSSKTEEAANAEKTVKSEEAAKAQKDKANEAANVEAAE